MSLDTKQEVKAN